MNLALTLSGGILIIPPVNATRCSDGAIAQLGERLHGMQEVSGSIPLSSTKPTSHQVWSVTPESRGAIAQLGERLHGMQEVSGSIPLSSTKIETLALWREFLLLQLPYAVNRSCFTLRHFLASLAKGFYH